MLKFLVLACLALAGVCQASLRGVDPLVRKVYREAEASGQFVCLDGLRSIPFAWVNDDYCDCFDGSDEPGVLG